ncbi:dihydrodipicolinate synthase family protein [Armatimonas rosea]|uniref:Dihydrodipicolinate synthase/N-acetylneuraminate lyase n=1 Tax=Armatimonas rosea TaxID=685828 RepID=A0A7W9SNX0_ARMRO|nr:dihydrodipicolinate synthase family protein [Armatimonas rosea]MBB6050112.1 dihydrodipicolinate synthase/N-acetylneuraminate lyase [Armatimonas rosea]
MSTINSQRQALQAALFPGGIPRLWCPTLTHFQAAHMPDPTRIQAHLTALAPQVKGILVPGSTGEGWEMGDDDIHRLLGIVLDAAAVAGIRVLIGVLKTSVEELLACLESLEPLRTHPAVAGVTICPPKGSELSQEALRAGLAQVLARGWPTALYQLPQVTQNELAPETVAALTAEFANVILFKDTSGADRVAQSGLDFGGVFLVRGAEKGGYVPWPRTGGGPYDGFLLSTANVFAPELAELLRLLDSGEQAAAEALSQTLETVVSAAFALVAEFPHGNAFANANKVLDHCRAYGDDALKVEPPLLYGGARLPQSFIVEGIALLKAHGLLPTQGYLRG